MLRGDPRLYLHPLAGVLAIVLAVYAARLGLRSRSRRRDAALARARHRAVTPWLYALVLLNWAGGLAAVRALLPEHEPAASGHFAVGSAIALLLTAAAALSRRIGVDARARAVHPWLGAVALVLCGVQVLLGLQLLP